MARNLVQQQITKLYDADGTHVANRIDNYYGAGKPGFLAQQAAPKPQPQPQPRPSTPPVAAQRRPITMAQAMVRLGRCGTCGSVPERCTCAPAPGDMLGLVIEAQQRRGLR